MVVKKDQHRFRSIIVFSVVVPKTRNGNDAGGIKRSYRETRNKRRRRLKNNERRVQLKEKRTKRERCTI